MLKYPMLSNLQNKTFALCPQLHRLVVKHKVLVLEQQNKINNDKVNN
jgi:hypothetical protein